jgi:hypothetical protein
MPLPAIEIQREIDTHRVGIRPFSGESFIAGGDPKDCLARSHVRV